MEQTQLTVTLSLQDLAREVKVNKDNWVPEFPQFPWTLHLSLQFLQVRCGPLWRNSKHKNIKTPHRKDYYLAWKQFNKFFIQLDHKPRDWEDRLVLFVAYLAETNKQSSTIQIYVSAMKSVLMDEGLEINENKFLVSSLMKACWLCNDVLHTRLPIHKGVLAMIVNEIKNRLRDQGQVYLATLYVAFFSWLCTLDSSELVSLQRANMQCERKTYKLHQIKGKCCSFCGLLRLTEKAITSSSSKYQAAN